MMGRQKNDQGQLFYSFCLDEVVPDDHLVREIAAVLDLSWVHGELEPYYPSIGRPRSIRCSTAEAFSACHVPSAPRS
jgi:hypothetical protein